MEKSKDSNADKEQPIVMTPTLLFRLLDNCQESEWPSVISACLSFRFDRFVTSNVKTYNRNVSLFLWVERDQAPDILEVVSQIGDFIAEVPGEYNGVFFTSCTISIESFIVEQFPRSS